MDIRCGDCRRRRRCPGRVVRRNRPLRGAFLPAVWCAAPSGLGGADSPHRRRLSAPLAAAPRPGAGSSGQNAGDFASVTRHFTDEAALALWSSRRDRCHGGGFRNGTYVEDGSSAYDTVHYRLRSTRCCDRDLMVAETLLGGARTSTLWSGRPNSDRESISETLGRWRRWLLYVVAGCSYSCEAGEAGCSVRVNVQRGGSHRCLLLRCSCSPRGCSRQMSQ